jgi:calcineurin-like phosphoesterase family protein
MSNRWFTSDTHFGHANIISFCDRPFADFEEMDEALIANWNSVVGDDDVVYHMGDVAMGKWDRWEGIFNRLNGYKILVVGNHDRVFKGANTKTQEKFAGFYDDWFDEVDDSLSHAILANGTRVKLSHFPYNGDHTNEDRFDEYRLPDDGVTPLIHGHTHYKDVISKSKRGTIQIHVGVDAHNYTPVSEQQVIDYIRVAGDLK